MRKNKRKQFEKHCSKQEKLKRKFTMAAGSSAPLLIRSVRSREGWESGQQILRSQGSRQEERKQTHHHIILTAHKLPLAAAQKSPVLC